MQLVELIQKKSPAYVKQKPMRTLVLLCVAASISALLFALTVQYILKDLPCELCYAQRGPYILVAIIGSIAAWRAKQDGTLSKIALLCALLFFVDAGIAAYHSMVEQHWIKGPSACTNSDTGEKTLEQMREEIRNAQLVSCDEPTAYFLGITLATWNGVFALFLALGTFTVWRNIPRWYPWV